MVKIVLIMRNVGKRIVIIGESHAPEKLRKCCNKFIEI